MSNELTAKNNKGEWETKSIEAWAKLKGVEPRYLRQRKRVGYSDNDAVNMLYGKSPKAKIRHNIEHNEFTKFWDKFLYNRNTAGEG